ETVSGLTRRRPAGRNRLQPASRALTGAATRCPRRAPGDPHRRASRSGGQTVAERRDLHVRVSQSQLCRACAGEPARPPLGEHSMNTKLLQANPGWVDATLNWRWTWPLARVALSAAYVVGGLTKLFNFQDAIAEQAHFGISPPALFAALTIAVELIG